MPTNNTKFCKKKGHKKCIGASSSSTTTNKQQVPLERRTILDGHVTMLAPSPVTDSGRANGGWMDHDGITAAGLGCIFWALHPVECFYSNNAYKKEGFCTMHLELHPMLEDSSNDDAHSSTAKNLTRFLQSHVQESENEIYQSGNYCVIEEVPKVIADPASTVGSSATMIVQHVYKVCITPSPNILAGLAAATIASLLYFRRKANVIFKANNFEHHNPPLKHTQLLASIEYKQEALAF